MSETGHDLGAISSNVRRRVLELARCTPVHLGASLSVADILVALYFGPLRVRGAWSGAVDRDRIILSKGHASAALYFTLAAAGILDVDASVIGREGDTRAGHPTDVIPGVEISTGSLGHGLPVGAGMALASQLRGTDCRVCVVLGDGEMNEGSVWEAIMFASHRRLGNLFAIVDHNRLQQSGTTREVLNLDPLVTKWEAFGWRTTVIDGHSHAQLTAAIEWACAEDQGNSPAAVIAETVKGRGVSFMEHQLAWHHAMLDDTQFAAAMASLARPEPALP